MVGFSINNKGMCEFRFLRRIFLLCAWFFVCALSAQTVIDLGAGGGVRARGSNERETLPPVWRTSADSAEWRDCMVRGFNALSRDSLVEAEKLFRRALTLFPDAQSAVVVRHNLGRIAMARQDYQEAVKQLTDILKNFPERHEVRFDRATCYLEQGNTQMARIDIDALMAASPTEIERKELLFLRAAISMKERLYRAAKTDLEEVLRLSPENVNVSLLLAIADEKDGRPQEALNRLNVLLQAHPGEVQALVLRADIEAGFGRFEAARVDYDSAIRLAPDEAELYVRRASVLLRCGAKGAARKDLDEAVRRGIPRSSLLSLYEEL